MFVRASVVVCQLKILWHLYRSILMLLVLHLLSKLYGGDIAEVKFDTTSAIGNVVVEQALAGDFKAAELYLRSKGGWSPTNTVEEREVGSEEEEDRSAVEEIMTRLGKNTPDEHEDNG
jgi:hypothetical protein